MSVEADLGRVAQELVSPGKGILAADESLPTIKKRFDKIGVESTEENRRTYRELLLTTPGMGEGISGVILFDETTKQRAKDGTLFVDLLHLKKVSPGIKVDGGLEDFGTSGEKTTKGLDGLAARLIDYAKNRLIFTKWRAVYKITPDTPTNELISENAKRLAEFALMSQEAGLVPIVEPEVLIDGDHSIETAKAVSINVLREVFARLTLRDVDLSGMLLKPSMVLPGKDSMEKVTDNEIAIKTLEVLWRTVPEKVPGIVFLSGGQTPEEATRRLSAMNEGREYRDRHLPLELSFSFGRALQDEALKTWAGKPENVKAAQDVFYKWVEANHKARYGRYNPQA